MLREENKKCFAHYKWIRDFVDRQHKFIRIPNIFITMKTYNDIDKNILKALPNPTSEAYEIKIKIPEFTFLGVKEQPDFAKVFIAFYPKKHIIELRSLKQYIYQLRNIVISYERLINIIYDHLMEVYNPDRLRIVMICNPRGGISSKLTIDSDWKVRGGEEKYKDWLMPDDFWTVEM